MADRAQRYGMDPEDMRRVIVSIGQPAPARAWPLMPMRTALLLILLALAILLGLGSLAGATANWEPVKKGSARARDIQISPLEKLEMESPSATWQLYNFLQIFPIARAAASPLQPRAPLAMPESPATLIFDEIAKERKFDEPFKLTIALGFFALIVLWLHLRDRRIQADKNWRNRK